MVIQCPALKKVHKRNEDSVLNWFGIQCGENPGAGSVLVYTMIKNPSGDGAMLRAIDLAGPILPPPGDFEILE